MAIEAINPPTAESTYQRFHFSQAVRTGELVVCAGQIGLAANGRPPAEIEDEFHAAWRAVGEVLDAAGLGYVDIVEYTTFHVGLRVHMATFMRVRDEYVTEPWPVWTAIGITELAVPDAHVEIRVIAQGRP